MDMKTSPLAQLKDPTLLKTDGYADDAALETEWYEWMESRGFK